MNSLKKILLIDEDHLFVNNIKTALSPDIYKVIHAPTCLSGIHKAFQHFPDIIFYNTNLDPLDGPEVFKTLQSTSPLSNIPIVFYNDQDDEQIKYLINNNGNEIHANVQILEKLNILREDRNEKRTFNGHEVVYDFNTLFHLSPNALFIFDSKGILSINQMLKDLLKTGKQEISVFKMEDIFEKSSARTIKQWMKNYAKNEKSAFRQPVILIDRAGDEITMNLMISELKKTDEYIHFLGTFLAIEKTNPIFNYQLAHEVCNLLKRENLEVSEALEKKITHAIKSREINEDHQKKSFFTRRENEVLRLSMEGLSIKIIADKLSLSTRTVEKYRTKLMVKSGAKNIVEVIVFSIKNNLLKI